MPGKQHPRTVMVDKAEIKLEEMFLKWIEEDGNELTYLEVLRALNTVTMRTLKYAIRQERHPDDPNRPGDEE